MNTPSISHADNEKKHDKSSKDLNLERNDADAAKASVSIYRQGRARKDKNINITASNPVCLLTNEFLEASDFLQKYGRSNSLPERQHPYRNDYDEKDQPNFSKNDVIDEEYERGILYDRAAHYENKEGRMSADTIISRFRYKKDSLREPSFRVKSPSVKVKETLHEDEQIDNRGDLNVQEDHFSETNGLIRGFEQCDIVDRDIATKAPEVLHHCPHVVFDRPLRVKTDVLVNYTTKDLALNIGNTFSQRLLQVAGPSVQEELNKEHPSGLGTGQVAKTQPGNLSTCKALCHITLPTIVYSDRDSESKRTDFLKVLVSAVKKVLEMASSEGFKTVVFPSLGTKDVCWSVAYVVHCMFLAVSEFYLIHELSDVKVYFAVSPDEEVNIKQLFTLGSFTWRYQTTKATDVMQVHKELWRNPTSICETRLGLGSTTLQISNGTQQMALTSSKFIFVLWQDKDIQGKENQVLSCLDESKQRNIIIKYVPNPKKKKIIKDNESVPNRTLIHLYIKNADMDPLVRALGRGFDVSDTSISIPVPHDGSKLWLPTVAAEMIVRAVQGRRDVLAIVRVVILDTEQLEPFLTVVHKSPDCKVQAPPGLDLTLGTDEQPQDVHRRRRHPSLSADYKGSKDDFDFPEYVDIPKKSVSSPNLSILRRRQTRAPAINYRVPMSRCEQHILREVKELREKGFNVVFDYENGIVIIESSDGDPRELDFLDDYLNENQEPMRRRHFSESSKGRRVSFTEIRDSGFDAEFSD